MKNSHESEANTSFCYTNYSEFDINNLPAEILERIFSFTSQYKDYVNLSRVCKKWHSIIENLRQVNKKTFAESFHNGQIKWQCVEEKFAPTQRHSHSCVRLNDKLYVFGGLSGTSTSYNDLWIFDLNEKKWSRPNTSGAYPSPKAAASLLVHRSNQLLLYGGYSHPYSYSFSQQVNFFDELHVFDIKKNFWIPKLFVNQEPPKLAGHTASFLHNETKMILFGGCNGSLGNKTNQVFCLDLIENQWINLITNSNSYKPEARYGHSQTSLDNERILIIGGCGGPNKQYDDVWILYISSLTNEALWQQVMVKNNINSPTQLYCISFVLCEENKKLVTFGKPRMPPYSSSSKDINGASNSTQMSSVPPISLNNPFGGMIGDGFQLNSLNKYTSEQSDAFTIVGQSLQLRKCTCSSSSPLSSASASPHSTRNHMNKSSESLDEVDNSLANEEQAPNELQLRLLSKSQRNTIKRLEALKKIATKFNKLKEEKEQKIIQQLNSTTYLSKTQKHCVIHSNLMQMFILDVANLYIQNDASAQKIIDSTDQIPSVTWQTPIAQLIQAPSDTILYSLSQGIDELILYGGMELDSPLIHLKPSYDYIKNRVSNKLYIIKPFYI
jgi:F-box protein 42